MDEHIVNLDEHSCRRAIEIAQFYGGNTLQGAVILCIQVLHDQLKDKDPDFAAMLARSDRTQPKQTTTTALSNKGKKK